MVLSCSGSVERVPVRGALDPARHRQALLASLTGWEFRAATKDGAAVMVEFLLSIPAKGL